MRAHYAHRDYVRYAETLDDSDDDEGPTNEDAWLYEDLTILAKLYSRLKDREQLIALIFEVSKPCLVGFVFFSLLSWGKGLAFGFPWFVFGREGWMLFGPSLSETLELRP